MYAYIKGILAEITEDAIIVENQGIGYEIAVPGQVFDYLPSVGEEVKSTPITMCVKMPFYSTDF